MCNFDDCFLEVTWVQCSRKIVYDPQTRFFCLLQTLSDVERKKTMSGMYQQRIQKIDYRQAEWAFLIYMKCKHGISCDMLKLEPEILQNYMLQQNAKMITHVQAEIHNMLFNERFVILKFDPSDAHIYTHLRDVFDISRNSSTFFVEWQSCQFERRQMNLPMFPEKDLHCIQLNNPVFFKEEK